MKPTPKHKKGRTTGIDTSQVINLLTAMTNLIAAIIQKL